VYAITAPLSAAVEPFPPPVLAARLDCDDPRLLLLRRGSGSGASSGSGCGWAPDLRPEGGGSQAAVPVAGIAAGARGDTAGSKQLVPLVYSWLCQGAASSHAWEGKSAQIHFFKIIIAIIF
jgi:hypothetical protein